MAESGGAAYQYPDPPARGPQKLGDWLKRLLGLFSSLKTVRALHAHNAGLAEYTTRAGKQELDRLVLMEAVVLARLRSATELIESGNIDELIERSGLPKDIVDPGTKGELGEAARDKNFVEKLWEKCKSVANEKVKGGIKGWFGGKSDDDE